VVIFSDGRMNGGDTDAATMAAVTGVPVYAVGVAARAGVRDISITNAVVPSTATVGETIPLNVEVRGVGMRGVSTDVTVTGGGDAETRWIRFEDDQRISLSFNRKFTVVGLGQLTVEVAPVAGELSVQNNRVQRWVEVLPAGSKSAATTRPATQPAIEAEMADLTGDEGWLRRLAEASSGQFLRLDQVDLLPRRLGEMHEDANHPVEIPLWDGVYLYALVLGCLATEWGMRKRFGLA
jgi:hypothetical protein